MLSVIERWDLIVSARGVSIIHRGYTRLGYGRKLFF